MIYDTIYHPQSKQFVSIYSTSGKEILTNYIKQLGGKKIGQGVAKCVFSPPIKCHNKTMRFQKRLTSSNDYVSAVMEVDSAKTEKKEISILKKLDPKGEFTLPLVHECKIGEMDPTEESRDQFEECSNLEEYSYPFNHQNLTQLIFEKGGKEVHDLIFNMNYEEKNIYKIDMCKFIQNFKTVIYGLSVMNKNGYIHSDLKPQNILFNQKTNRFYIIDFGFTGHKNTFFEKQDGIYFDYINRYEYWPIDSGIANFLNDPRKNIDDIINEISRTHLNKTRYNQLKVQDHPKFIDMSIDRFDVYSLGISMAKIFDDYLFKILRKEAILSKSKITLLKKKLRQLIRKMLEPNPINRLSIHKVLDEYNFIMKQIFSPPSKSKKKQHKKNNKKI